MICFRRHGPPGLAAEVAQRLRDSFDRTVKDGAFLADAEKLKFDIGAMNAAAVDKSVSRLYATPQPIVEKVGASMAHGGE